MLEKDYPILHYLLDLMEMFQALSLIYFYTTEDSVEREEIASSIKELMTKIHTKIAQVQVSQI